MFTLIYSVYQQKQIIMTNKNVKERRVMDFDKFKGSYDQAKKVIMLKKDESAHPGANPIKGEPLYVRNDANPYKAMGIPHDEKIADINKYMSANKVDVFHDRKLTADEKKKIDDLYGNQTVTHHQMAFILDESIDDSIKEFGIIDESLNYLKDVNTFDLVENEEEKESEEEPVDKEEEYKAEYTGKTVILNGDSAKIHDEDGIAHVRSKDNDLVLTWKGVHEVMSKKDGNFTMKVEKKKEEKEEDKEEKDKKLDEAIWANRDIKLGKVGKFDLVYQRWSKSMNGNGITGTIRTTPANYYVATIDEEGEISFDDLESHTKDIDKEEVTKLYNDHKASIK